MVDRNARDQALELLRRVLTGTIANWEFEDEWPPSADLGVTAIGSRLWCFYSDFPRQRLSIDQFDREEVAILDRCMTFLRSSADYRWPDFAFDTDGLRPFEGFLGRTKLSARRWEEFCRAGDIAWWPFLGRDDHARASAESADGL